MVSGTPDLRAALVDLERRFWLQGAGAPDFWRTHFADDGLVALPLGIMDKSETVAAMVDGQPWTHVDLEDVRVVPVTDSSAILTYAAAASRPNETGVYRAIVGSLYVRTQDTWQLMFHQQSPRAE
jgi:hypothetical protein